MEEVTANKKKMKELEDNLLYRLTSTKVSHPRGRLHSLRVNLLFMQNSPDLVFIPLTGSSVSTRR